MRGLSISYHSRERIEEGGKEGKRIKKSEMLRKKFLKITGEKYRGKYSGKFSIREGFRRFEYRFFRYSWHGWI